MKRQHDMPFGAQVGADESTRFRLWAPAAKRVVLDAQSDSAGRLQADLNEAGEGWHELVVTGVGAGARYKYRIDDEIDVADPASRFNPDGVQGASEVIDAQAFDWRDDAWRGREWHEAVIYETHVGTFTAEGTYDAATARLDELADLGVTALELMPLAAFPGSRGWGYDTVLPYAPHAAYGRPENLKRLVQEAHARNLMVLLDVVYNHFGPEGNYLPRYAPQVYTSKHRTPWGDAINFAAPTVREFFIHNALYWLDEYHLDGLRVDAVHAMHDESATHFIDELVERVSEGPGRERRVHVVLENHRNEAHRLRSRTIDVAQWNDDFHHALHVIVSGERDGYYIDYADDPLEHLGRALAQGFAYQGERSRFSGELRGERSGDLPPTAFVNFLQNHDQIGNRAFGERLHQLTEPPRLRAALAILLLSPQIPMSFMGEEYAAEQPFLYFCDYQGELAKAISAGRREEFAGFSAFADEAKRASIPDPNMAETFERSRLVWAQRSQAPHAAWLQYTRDLLRARAHKVVPLIRDILPSQSTYQTQGSVLTVRWPTRGGTALRLDANLGDAAAAVSEENSAELLYSISRSPRTGGTLAAWDVWLRSERA